LTPEEFDRIRRFGTFAKNMLADATFLDVLKGLKEDAIAGWTDAKSLEQRETFWRDMQAVGRLKAKLEDLDQKYNAEIVKLENAQQREKRAAVRREEMSRG
jgi:hypothetical protein